MRCCLRPHSETLYRTCQEESAHPRLEVDQDRIQRMGQETLQYYKPFAEI